MRTARRRFLQAAGSVALLWPVAVQAGQTVLTVQNTRVGGRNRQVNFTRDDLADLEQQTITTGNDFIDGVSSFRGPAVSGVIDMIERAGAETARVTSLSDFFVDINIEELRRYGAILAIEQDGIELPRRGKGPIWLMYPIDLYPELKDSVYNSRLIWQVRTIDLF